MKITKKPRPPEIWQMNRVELEHAYLALLNRSDWYFLIVFMAGFIAGAGALALLAGLLP